MSRIALILAVATAALAIVATGARADYRETVQVLRIGMLANQMAGADPARLDAVEKAISANLGIPTEIIRFPSFSALIDAHASARVQYAIHSAVSYAATEAVCGCVTPLRRPVSGDGAVGFRSVLVVRDRAAADIAALKIAFSNEASVSGWTLPREAMASGGLAKPQLVRAGTVSAALDLYLDGSVDGFFAWIPEIAGKAPSTTPADLFGGIHAGRLAGGDPLRMLWLSEPVLNGPHAVHRALPEDLVAALGTFLDEMPTKAPGLLDIIEPLHSGGFVEAVPENYRTLRSLIDTAARR